MPSRTPELFSISAAAAEIGCCVETVRRYCDDGIINCVRDSAGRRLLTPTDIQRAREYRAQTAQRSWVRR